MIGNRRGLIHLVRRLSAMASTLDIVMALRSGNTARSRVSRRTTQRRWWEPLYAVLGKVLINVDEDVHHVLCCTGASVHC